MGAPVGELAAGVLIPPAKLIVAALFPVIDLRRLSQPHIPVQVARRFGHRERSTGGSSVDADHDLFDVTQQPFLHHIDGSQEPIVTAALLSPHQEDSVVILSAGVANQLVFFECQCERLLAEDMLAGLQGFDRDFDMPVIRSDHADHINVITLQHATVVDVQIGLALADLSLVLSALGMVRIHIADSQDVTKLSVLSRVSAAHASHADAANSGTVIGRLIGESWLRPRKCGRGRCCGCQGRGSKECSTGGRSTSHRDSFLMRDRF